MCSSDLDEGFGEDGKIITSFTEDSDTAYALVIQPDGEIVVGGEANFGTSATGQDFAKKFEGTANVEVIDCPGKHVASECYRGEDVEKWMAEIG